MDARIVFIARQYGLGMQMTQLLEEMAELAQAICKYDRYGNTNKTYNDIVEEMADVEIMLEKVKYLLDVSNHNTEEEVQRIREYKLNRQVGRICEGGRQEWK